MYVGSYAICVLNWNWWLTQDHFLIKHWSQRTHRCSARVVGLEEYLLVLVSRYSTVRSGTLIWREWGLWNRRPGWSNRDASDLRCLRSNELHANDKFWKSIASRLAKSQYTINTLLAKNVVTPPCEAIKSIWIDFWCCQWAEIYIKCTCECSPTKSDLTLAVHSLHCQVGSSMSKTAV